MIDSIVFSIKPYDHLIPAWLYFYRRLGIGGTATIFHFDETIVDSLEWEPWNNLSGRDLRDFVKFVNVGEFDSYGTEYVWADALIKHEEHIPKLFAHFFEAGIPFGIRDSSMLKDAITLMEGNVSGKFVLESQDHHVNSKKLSRNIGILHARAAYRKTLSPSVFRKEYFMQSLSPGDSPWSYEQTVGSYDTNILVPKDHSGAIKCIDVYRKGFNNKAYFDDIGIERTGFYNSLDPSEEKLFLETADIITDKIKPRKEATTRYGT